MKSLTEMALALNLINHMAPSHHLVTDMSISNYGPIDDKILNQLKYFGIDFVIDESRGDLFCTIHNQPVQIIANMEHGFYVDPLHKLLAHYVNQ